MEAEEARTRRGLWFGRPCVHPEIEHQEVQGTWSGGYVCRVCGSEFSKISMWEGIYHFLQQEMDAVQVRETVEPDRQLQPIGI